MRLWTNATILIAVLVGANVAHFGFRAFDGVTIETLIARIEGAGVLAPLVFAALTALAM